MSQGRRNNCRVEPEKKDEETKCYACMQTFPNSDNGITCAQAHFLCSTNGCFKTYISYCFENPKENFPPKCKACDLVYNPNQLEAHMTELEQGIFHSLSLRFMDPKDLLKPGEILVHCPECTYFEIRFDSKDINFVHCLNSECKKISCFVCKKGCDVADIVEEDEEEEEKKANEVCSVFEYHRKCLELKAVKEDLETAIENGSIVRCPECGVGGRKDDACTHMICFNCKTTYCYVCGLSEQKCDKRQKQAGMYSHNEDWDSNPRRCPMYLSQINEVDSTWPEDDSKALDHFHQLRIRQSLQVLLLGYSSRNELRQVEAADAHFQTLASQKITISDNRKPKTITLFQRQL